MNEKEKAIIKARKAEAKKLGIYGMAQKIARQFGEREGKKHGAMWIFDDGQLRILWDDYAPNLWITWKKQAVYNSHLGELTGFRPDIGEWIQRIKRLYATSIQPKLDKEAKKKEEERRKELYERWGVRIGEENSLST